MPDAVDEAAELVAGTDATGVAAKLAPSPAPPGNRPLPAGITGILGLLPNVGPKPLPGLRVNPGLRPKPGPRPLKALMPIPEPNPPPGLRPIPMGIPIGTLVVAWEFEEEDGCDWLLAVVVFLT